MPRIINIASRLGTKPIEESVAYCTSEAATIMLTQCCALELTKKYNIKTNTVSPSMTLTPLAKKSYTEDEIKQTAMKNPSGRLGEVEDTVNAVTKEIYTYGNMIALNLGTEVEFINTDGWLVKRYIANQEITNIVMSNNIAGIIYRDRIEIINL